MFSQFLAARRGLPPGDQGVCEEALRKHCEMLHSKAPGRWEDNLTEVSSAARNLATKHAKYYRKVGSHVSARTSASLETSRQHGGKVTDLVAIWERSRTEVVVIPTTTSVSDFSGDVLYLGRGRRTISEIYLGNQEAVPGNPSLSDSLRSELGGRLVVTMALIDLHREGLISFVDPVLKGYPFWTKGRLGPGSITPTGVSPRSRVICLPEEGWKARVLAVPSTSYSILGQAARHWLQDNLVEAEPRVGIGFQSAHKLWDLCKRVTRNQVTEFRDLPSVSADISNCTDSSSLRTSTTLMTSYLRRLEELGVSVPSVVWLMTYLTAVPHTFEYPDGWTTSQERPHQTGVMMGEHLSFIIMVLQNLTIDDRITLDEQSERAGALHSSGVFTAIVGDDYVRLFTSEWSEYSRLAADWYSWTTSPGKHGASRQCVQLAEEFGYVSDRITKQDVVKVKYVTVPGPNQSKETAAWVGRAQALTKALWWASRDGHLSDVSARVLIDSFRQVNRLKSIPLVATLPQPLGGMLFPTMRSVQTVLRRTGLRTAVTRLLGQSQSSLSTYLQSLTGCVKVRGSGKGNMVPSRARELALLVRAKPVVRKHTPTVERTSEWTFLSTQMNLGALAGPFSRTDLSMFLAAQPSTPNAVRRTRGTQVVVTDEWLEQWVQERGLVSLSDLVAQTERLDVLADLLSNPVRDRSMSSPALDGLPGRIWRILRTLDADQMDADSWEFCKERLTHLTRKGFESLDLGVRILLEDLYVGERSPSALLFEGSFSWSFRYRKMTP